MQKEKYKITIVSALVIFVCVFTWFTNQFHNTHTVVTHLYYIPIRDNFFRALMFVISGFVLKPIVKSDIAKTIRKVLDDQECSLMINYPMGKILSRLKLYDISNIC